MEINRNASDSLFGWQFQINVAIYLMFKYFKRYEEIKVEGEKEDIEIALSNSKKIYVQAKSKRDTTNSNGYSTKLKDALNSLADIKNEDIEQLIYISNLEPNPLNSGTTDEFNQETFLKYNELRDVSREKIDNQLINLNKTIDKEKLLIAVIPFYGDDERNRKKSIYYQIESFLAYSGFNLVPYSKRLLEMWETEFFNNGSAKSPYITIKKENVLWQLVILQIERDNIKEYDSNICNDEEDYQMAIDRYEKIINNREGDFRIYNGISNLYSSIKQRNQNIKVNEFINNYTNEIYDIVFKDNKDENKELLEKICSKIIAKRIIYRRGYLDDCFRKANNYEN